VKKIASNLAIKIKYKVCPEELASYGVIGLYDAIESFKKSKGVKFETFSYTRIWGSMLDEIRKNDWVPRSVRTRYNELSDLKAKMEAKNCRKVSYHEVIKKAGLSVKKFHKNIHHFLPNSFSSLENNTFNKDSEFEGDNKDSNKYLEDKRNLSFDLKISKKEFIKNLLKSFNKIERKIVYFYYYEGLTMKEISKIVNISESRISQMHNNVIGKLKKKLKSNFEFFEKHNFKKPRRRKIYG